ncbi:hypothetical protein Asi02nite_22610 [Asanoa siamensis]|uniref:Uncharacterized protein n=2 Tax=Asanoa siamensis TaxID=926357 RepID=A0ABQ4CP20_9ACTN|nr:hypothetical protein Asi02nite_22610 [Asanoa siamensis]
MGKATLWILAAHVLVLMLCFVGTLNYPSDAECALPGASCGFATRDMHLLLILIQAVPILLASFLSCVAVAGIVISLRARRRWRDDDARVGWLDDAARGRRPGDDLVAQWEAVLADKRKSATDDEPRNGTQRAVPGGDDGRAPDGPE